MIGGLLLALWLLLTGLTAVAPVAHPVSPLLPWLAILAGVLLLVGR